jgi:outer membrane biosynthesis protein TonB
MREAGSRKREATLAVHMRKLLRVIPLLVLAPLLGACASTWAKGKPADRPAMNVPPPPPRIIEPTPEPEPEPVNDLPAPPPNSGTSRPPRPTPPKPEAKAEPPAEVSPKPEAAKPAEAKADPSSPSSPQLRTPQTADTNGAEKNVHATVERANTMLNGVDYGPLSNERKKAYNDAKRFIRQAEDALKRGNYLFAQGVATKAETLARELSGK